MARTREQSRFKKGNVFLTYDIYQRAKKIMKNKMKQTEFANVIKGFHNLITDRVITDGSVDLPLKVGSLETTMVNYNGPFDDDVMTVYLNRHRRKGKRFANINNSNLFKSVEFNNKILEANESGNYVVFDFKDKNRVNYGD